MTIFDEILFALKLNSSIMKWIKKTHALLKYTHTHNRFIIHMLPILYLSSWRSTVPKWTQQHVIVVDNRLNFTRKAWNRKEADNSCSIINCCCIVRELQKLQRKAKYWIQNIKRSLMLRAPNTQLQTQVEGIKKGWPTPKKLSIPVFIKVQCTRTNLKHLKHEYINKRTRKKSVLPYVLSTFRQVEQSH